MTENSQKDNIVKFDSMVFVVKLEIDACDISFHSLFPKYIDAEIDRFCLQLLFFLLSHFLWVFSKKAARGGAVV